MRKKLLIAVVVLVVINVAAYLWGAAGAPEPIPLVEPPPHRASNPGHFDLSIVPSTASVDTPVSIVIRDLEPQAAVTLWATMQDARDRTFTSWATFTADSEGVVNLANVAPLAGTYQAADPTGLLWSMRGPADETFRSGKDWSSRQVTFRAESSGAFTTASIERTFPRVGLTTESVREDGVVAELSFLEVADDKPLLIVLGGWGDGPSTMTSALFARRGFAVMNVGYHGWEGTPEALVRIPAETVSRAIDWVTSNTRIDTSDVGVYGVSKGAELALLAASIDPRIAAVAAWTPACVVFAGIDFGETDPGPSWTVGGQDIPYAAATIGLHDIRNSIRILTGHPMIFRPAYEKALAFADEESRIKIELSNAEILLVSGSDDQVWPADIMARQLEQRATRFQRPTVVHMTFAGAGHGITPSLLPSVIARSRFFWRGGSPEADHRAGQQAWKSTLALFQRVLEPAPEPAH